MPPDRRRALRVSELVVGTVLAVTILLILAEAVLDYFNVSLDAATLAQTLIDQPQLFAVPLVLIEEAGVPLPVSGDLLIMYSAARAGPNLYTLLALGLEFEIAVLLGSSTLYVVSRHLGPRVLYSPVGAALRLTPSRIERAQRLIKRWGIWAVLLGRFVPGFRVAVTVVAGSLELEYHVFITGVTIAAAIWIALFMALGVLVGPAAERLLAAHQNSSLLLVAVVALGALLYVGGRLAWRRRAAV